MANFFDQFDSAGQPAEKSANFFDQFDAPKTDKSYQGGVLPLSRDAGGAVHFDSNAGILGSIKRAVTLPGDVYSGKEPMYGPDGRTSPEVIGRSTELAATVSPMNPAARAGDAAIPGISRGLRPQVPTAEELYATSTAGYNAARKSGVEIGAGPVKDWGLSTRGLLEQDGISEVLAPKTFAILKQIDGAPNDAIATVANLETIRRALGHAAGDFTNKTEQLAASRAIERLDGFISKDLPQSALAGPAAQTAKTLEDARGNYAAASRSDAVTGRQDMAALRAKVANSGQNLDNATRQRFVDIASDGKAARGFNDDEVAQARALAEGGPFTNTARALGNILGGGGGLGTVAASSAGAGAGFAAGGPMGAAIGATVPVAGWAAKKLANYLTTHAADKLDDAVRSRSPMYQNAVENSAMLPDSEIKRAALAKMLSLWGVEQPRGQ